MLTVDEEVVLMDQLRMRGACSTGLEWLKYELGGHSPQAIWGYCDEPAYLAWVLWRVFPRVSKAAEYRKRAEALGDLVLTLPIVVAANDVGGDLPPSDGVGALVNLPVGGDTGTISDQIRDLFPWAYVGPILLPVLLAEAGEVSTHEGQR